MMENQGLMVKLIRQNLNLDQVEFAKKLGITSAQVSNYERNRVKIPNVYIDKLAKISGFSKSEIEHSISITTFQRKKSDYEKKYSSSVVSQPALNYERDISPLYKMLMDQSETIKEQHKTIQALLEECKK
jgi:transcriptional regulator with XRE-family HTH domain